MLTAPAEPGTFPGVLYVLELSGLKANMPMIFLQSARGISLADFMYKENVPFRLWIDFLDDTKGGEK